MTDRSPVGGLWRRDEGAGEAEAIVLLHGLSDSHDLWRHAITPLARQYRVIAFDLRGHGRSPLRSPEFSIADMAEDVRAALYELGLSRVILVGLSMGGGIAQTLAIRYPDLIRALVLVSTSSEFTEETRERFLTRASKAEREGMSSVVEATVPRWFTPTYMAEHPDEVERTRRSVLAIDPVAFAAASRANASRDLTSQIAQIRCPVLFIGGLADPADPDRASDIYRRELQNLRVHLIPGVSHLLPVEAPEEFVSLTLAFLKDIQGQVSGSRA